MSEIDYGYCSAKGHGSYSDSERACPWCRIAELETEALLKEVSTAMHPTNPHQWLVLDKVLRAVKARRKEKGK